MKYQPAFNSKRKGIKPLTGQSRDPTS